MPWAQMVVDIHPKAAGLKAAEGIYMRQTTSAHGITNIQHLCALIVHG